MQAEEACLWGGGETREEENEGVRLGEWHRGGPVKYTKLHPPPQSMGPFKAMNKESRGNMKEIETNQ